MTAPRLVIVGSIGIDHIETPFERRVNLLGGSASYACAAASFFSPPGMVGVVGDDFPGEFLDLYRTFSVNLEGLQRMPGRTFTWSGVYEENMDNRRTLETILGVFESFQPALPESYVDASHLFLGNMAPDLQLHVLDAVRRPEFVLMDTMDLWIRIARERLVEVIGRVNMLTLNESEARLLTGAHNLLSAADALLGMGPDYVLIKKGEHGSMLFGRSGIYLQPAYPLASVTDPTGAGDTFAGAVIGYLAETGGVSGEEIRRAMVYGSVVASFGVEAFSLDRLSVLDRSAIEARAAQLLEMMRVEASPPSRMR
jgi:sugar/nucleoside kinase (ribokinase family)